MAGGRVGRDAGAVHGDAGVACRFCVRGRVRRLRCRGRGQFCRFVDVPPRRALANAGPGGRLVAGPGGRLVERVAFAFLAGRLTYRGFTVPTGEPPPWWTRCGRHEVTARSSLSAAIWLLASGISSKRDQFGEPFFILPSRRPRHDRGPKRGKGSGGPRSATAK